MDVSATVGALGQGYAALRVVPAAQAFGRSPGVLSGLGFLDTAAAVVGVERLTGQLAKYAVKLALRGDGASEDAAAAMVEAMRARVPVDTGRLLHGIGWRKEGNLVTVEASALHGEDYARFVEFGHRWPPHRAEDAFGRPDHAALHTGAGPGEVEAEPFFWDSVREGLAQWREALGEAEARARREEGL